MGTSVTQQIGRYEILEEIGRGAMGVVFKGRDPLIGRAVAVKTITTGVAESADLLERFYREARAAGGLQHPNIVTIYEMAESAGAPFIAMEYLEGESLEKLIARKAALPLATRVSYVLQACRALDYAHRRGVIHRDVKPANIMVTRDGLVKVVDFGIARLADTSKTQTGALLGTLAYMAPEQLRGEQAGARCDIWALGVVLYELLAYQRPFKGENHAAVLLSILQNEPLPLRQVVPEFQIPLALERVVARSLLKDDKERYPSMEALLADLEKVSEGLRPEAHWTVGSKEILPAAAHEPMATQRIDVQTLTVAEPANEKAKPSPAARVTPQATLAIERPADGVTIAPESGALQGARRPAIQSGQPHKPLIEPATARSRRKAMAISLMAAALLIAVAFVYHRRISSIAAGPAIRSGATPSAPPLATASPANAATPQPAASSPPSTPTLEDEQRHLIDSAHEAADAHDYKTALARLDEAAKLKGPLNSLVPDLRREFSDQAYRAELQRAAGEEQALWDQGMADLKEGRLDDAEKFLRELLTLPAADRHWVDAERYVDEVIPQRRQELRLWSEAQVESASTERGHLMKEVKLLDEVLAEGGPHEQPARQMRNSVFRQVVRENARRNGVVEPTLSEGYEAQLAQLETEFGDLAVKGDAAALEGLQALRPKFKALADAGGPLAMDARDYLNSVIPKAQKQIEDNLAAVASESSANAAYEGAVKEYDRAVAAQNVGMLRGRVLAAFQQIAQSGGIRAKEAERYVHVLIPAALKKIG